jgi:hypothetical protein
MAEGPGKYDDLTTLVRERAKAHAVVVIVVEGTKGSGFSVPGAGGRDPQSSGLAPTHRRRHRRQHAARMSARGRLLLIV